MPDSPIRDVSQAGSAVYDMDSEDEEWLAEYNYDRSARASPLKAPQFEEAMTSLLSGNNRVAKPIDCVGEHSNAVLGHYKHRVANGKDHLMPFLLIGSGKDENEDGPYACFAPYNEAEEPMARQNPAALQLVEEESEDEADTEQGDSDGESEAEDSTWQVDRILGTRVGSDRVRRWHVQWESREKTWEPKESFLDNSGKVQTREFTDFEQTRLRRKRSAATKQHPAAVANKENSATGSRRHTRQKKTSPLAVKRYAANEPKASKSLKRKNSTHAQDVLTGYLKASSKAFATPVSKRLRHRASKTQPKTTRRMALSNLQFN